MSGLRSKAVMAALITALTICIAGATDAADNPFKIGGILSFSGAYGIIGESMRRGVEIAVEERGGKVLGRPIELIWEDDQTKADVAVQKGTRMLANNVEMLYGAISSSSTLALMRLSEQRKVPILVTASADDRITGSDKTQYAFRTSGNSTSENMSVAQFVKKAGWKKIYGVAADYTVMREGWSLLKLQLKNTGIDVIGEDFPPLGTSDYSVIIDKVAHSGADAVVVNVTGNDAVTFVKQAGEISLNNKVKIVGPNLMDELLANAAGASALGAQSAIRYHFTYENARNKNFVAAYRKKFNAFPDPFAGEAYDGMSWWLEVVDTTGTEDHAKWVAAFERSTNNDSVDGIKAMHPCNHQATQTGLWAQVIKGEPPLPAYTMKIIDEFPPEKIFKFCD